jgi:hypothetical protein
MRSPRPEAYNACLKWLRESGKGGYRPDGPVDWPIAALTGTDVNVLFAIDRLWALVANADNTDEVLHAIALAARQMQEHLRPMARELAARQLEWSDRGRYWPRVEKYMALAIDSRLVK